MQQVDQIIAARWVLPIAPENTILEHHAVVIDQGIIKDCLPIATAKQQYQAKQLTELPEHAVMPGLVNTHTHNPMVLFRGLADDLELMDWLNNYIWPAEGDLINADSVVDGSKLAFIEMIRGGTTCFNEHYFYPNETAKAATEMGIRACIGLQVMNVPNNWAKDEDEYIRRATEAYDHRVEHELIQYVVAPHAPYTNSDSSLRKAKALADQHKLPIHMHLHETAAELGMDKEKYGKHPIQRLHDLNMLCDRFIAVHMVHVSDAEMEIIKATNTSVVHCPESNLKLASGFAPIQKYMDKGINVALGTDGPASNNDLDMFGEMRTAAFIAKAVTQDPTAMPAAEALKMATYNGAKALGLEDKIGSIENGKAADLIAVDLGSYLTQPIYNPISHLVYAANRLQVTDVWIAGKQLLKSAEFCDIDVKNIVARANEWAKKADKYKSKASSYSTQTV